MKKIIILVLCIGLIVLAGCKDNPSFLVFSNLNLSCYNHSTAPHEEFCNNIDMEFIELHLDRWGCIDSNGEIHSYITRSVNKDYWIIGNKTYDMEWTC